MKGLNVGLMAVGFMNYGRYTRMVEMCRTVRLFPSVVGGRGDGVSGKVPVPTGFSSSFNQRRTGMRGK